MAYEVINEELQIAACSISDLTAAQAMQLLNQWDDKAKLSELTLFHDPETGLLVLNRDNKGFQCYRDIAVGFLSGDEAKQEEWLQSAPEESEETLRVLDHCAKWRKINREMDIIRKNTVLDINAWNVLEEIDRRYPSRVAVSNAYRYGVMQGKREERKRRRERVGEREKVLIELLCELEKMTIEELEAFRLDWLEELRRRNAPQRILDFSEIVVDTVIQKKKGGAAA